MKNKNFLGEANKPYNMHWFKMMPCKKYTLLKPIYALMTTL